MAEAMAAEARPEGRPGASVETQQTQSRGASGGETQ